MWYKEHFKIRAKLILALPLFVFASIFVVVTYSPHPVDNPWGETLFERWSQFGLIVTLAFAGLLGADSVSDEFNQGTISFLLSRPLSRKAVFNNKFGLAALILTSWQLVSNLAVLGLDQIPRSKAFYLMNENGDGLLPYSQMIPVKITNLANALELCLLMWLAGLTVLGLTTLLSIRTRNTLQTVIISFVVTLLVLIPINTMPVRSGYFRGFLDIAESYSLPIAGGLAGLALAFYLAGFRMFRRQEF